MTTPTSPNFRSLARLPRSGATWQIAHVGITGVIGDGSSALPLLCVQGDTIVRSVAVVEAPATATDWAQLVFDAMAKPGSPLKPGLPTALRVRDPEVAEALRKLVAPLKVRVETTGDFSSFDKAANRLGEFLAEGGEVEIPDFDRDLFAAAAAFARARPWRMVAGEPEFALSTQIPGWPNPVAVILGQAGETFGLVVYREDRYVPRRSNSGHGGSNDGPDSVVVLLDADPEPSTRKRALRHGYDLEPGWLPTFLRLVPGREPTQLSSPDHALLLTLALRAVHAWVDRWQKGVSRDQLGEPLALFGDRVVCRLANPIAFDTPYDLDDMDDVDDFDDINFGHGHDDFTSDLDETPLFGPNEKLPKAPAANSSAKDRAAAWHALDHVISDRCLARMSPALRAFPGLVTKDVTNEESALARSWLIKWVWAEVACDGIGMTVLHWARDRLSDPRALRWVRACEGAVNSIWQVRRIDPGHGVELENVVMPEDRRFVWDQGLASSAAIHQLLLACVCEIDDLNLVLTCHSHALPPPMRPVIIESVHQALSIQSSEAQSALHPSIVFPVLAKIWPVLVLKQNEQIANRKLQNTDGDAMLMTTDHFEVSATRHDEVRAALLKLPGAELDDDDNVDFIRPRAEDAKPSRGRKRKAEDTLLEVIRVGHARFAGAKLTLETNSIQRADALRTLAEGACGDALRFLARSHEDPMTSARGPANPPPLEAIPPEMLAMVSQLRQQHMQGWLDQSIPALGGKTPRQAVKVQKLRPVLIAMIEEIEMMESRVPEEQRIDVSMLRRVLGL